MRAARTLKLLAAGLGALALGQAAAAGPWEQYARDAQSSGHQPMAATVTALDTLAWQNGTGLIPGDGGVTILQGSPDKAFTWGTNGDGSEVYVHAFRTDSGEMIWSSPALETGVSVLFGSSSTPSADSATNSVYFGTGSSLYRLDADTGAIVWQRALDAGGSIDVVNASPHIGGGMVFLPTFGGFLPANKRLYAIDAATGAIAWSVQDGGPGSEAPVYVDDGGTSFVVTLRDKGMAAYDAASGVPIWSNAAPSDSSTSWTTTAAFFGDLCGHDGDIFAATYDFSGANSELLRVDGATGALLWRATNVINGSGVPNVAGGRVIIAGETSFLNPSWLEAYDAATGAPLWQRLMAESSTMWNVAAVSTSDVVYVTEGSFGNGLRLIDPATGNDIATTTTISTLAKGDPAIGDDGAIYVHHDGGMLACYRADPFPPAALPEMTLSDDDGSSAPGETDDPLIRVDIAGTSADEMRLGEEPYTGAWQPFATATPFTLSTARRAAELRTVYVQIRVGTQESPPVAATILFNTTTSVHDWRVFE